MTHTYKIFGMTCNGCRNHVEKALNEVPGVVQAEVHLEKHEAEIEMEKHIPLEEFQNALKESGGNYQISLPEKDVEKSGLMKHSYSISGMTCNGCRSHVEKVLNEVQGVVQAEVNLEKHEAVIEMKNHIPLEKFQKALEEDGGSYQIFTPGTEPKKEENKKSSQPKSHNSNPKSQIFYCPMHCEGDKTYD
ncbi:MAG TPA: heavy metal-associated domain-containing protein, partial [Salinimicrobium sp.]|nr:heavy metal-associated domain-containing protein [Salinimicrobium sp.]